MQGAGSYQGLSYIGSINPIILPFLLEYARVALCEDNKKE